MTKYALPLIGSTIVLSSLFATAAFAGWFDEEAPPADAKPLSAIIKALEEQGYRTITAVEFEDGRWEVEVKGPTGQEMELQVDPVSGAVVHPG